MTTINGTDISTAIRLDIGDSFESVISTPGERDLYEVRLTARTPCDNSPA